MAITSERVREIFKGLEQGDGAAFFEHVADKVDWIVEGTHNLAHRDIKPANLLVRGGKLYLIDVFFAQLHPSPWRQAVDLANMLLCLALRSSPQQVYQRALRRFSVGEINEAFAAARGLALPSSSAG